MNFKFYASYDSHDFLLSLNQQKTFFQLMNFLLGDKHLLYFTECSEFFCEDKVIAEIL